MRALVDTHIVLWWLADDPRLSEVHRTMIQDDANTLFVSAITLAEIAIKSSLGKLHAPRVSAELLTSEGFSLLPFVASHAEELRDLPWHHRDPFDRMLVSQALVERLPLLTVDRRLPAYEIDCL